MNTEILDSKCPFCDRGTVRTHAISGGFVASCDCCRFNMGFPHTDKRYDVNAFLDVTEEIITAIDMTIPWSKK